MYIYIYIYMYMYIYLSISIYEHLSSSLPAAPVRLPSTWSMSLGLILSKSAYISVFGFYIQSSVTSCIWINPSKYTNLSYD